VVNLFGAYFWASVLFSFEQLFPRIPTHNPIVPYFFAFTLLLLLRVGEQSLFLIDDQLFF